METAILLLGAGRSSRMLGRDKLLEDVDGLPLLRRQAIAARSATPLVFVTVPDLGHARARALSDLDVTRVAVPDAETGMATSLVRAVRAAPAKAALMVVPADMPDLSDRHFLKMISTLQDDPNAILRAATASGKAGHPVIFPPDLRSELTTIDGDSGARSVLDHHRSRVRLVPFDDDAAVTDLDTPEAWRAWREARARP